MVTKIAQRQQVAQPTRTRADLRKKAEKTKGFYNENVLAGKRKRFSKVDDMVAPLPAPCLPLTQSYVDVLKKMLSTTPPQRPPRQTWPTPETAITWPNDRRVPKGWTADEKDLDPADLEAQLVRVDERIANKILPQIFEQKKEQLLRLKAEQDAMIASEAAFPGLSLDVIRRLHDLKHMEKQLVTRGNDPCGMLPNIRAIITAYRTKQLDWNPPLVTYWSKGTQICQPRPFHYQEFFEINKEHDGHTDFWVEGLFSIGPQPQLLLNSQEYTGCSGGGWLRDVYLALRFPNNRQTQVQFEFLEDTGASYMSIFIDDFNLLNQVPPGGGPPAAQPPLLAAMDIAGFTGGAGDLYQVRAVEVNMVADGSGRLMTAWDWMPVIIMESPNHTSRVAGPYIHYKFYTASAPDGSGKGYAFNLKSGWGQLVPTVPDVTKAKQPQFGGPFSAFTDIQIAVDKFSTAGRTVAQGAAMSWLANGMNNFVGLPTHAQKPPPPGMPVGHNPWGLRQTGVQQQLPLPPGGGGGGGGGA